MRPDTKYFNEKYAYYNKLIFDGALPNVPIILSTRLIDLGLTRSETLKDINGKAFTRVKCIEMSIRLDMPEETYKMILVHEMIHCYIITNNLKDDSSHGHIFRKIMSDINQKFSMNVTVDGEGVEWYKMMPANRRYFFCLIKNTEGEVGICVTPKNKLFDFWNTLQNASSVKSFKWYTSFDPFFSQFHLTSILRYNVIDTEYVLPHLENAKELYKYGTTITTEKRL